jgi:hypothetical protein
MIRIDCMVYFFAAEHTDLCTSVFASVSVSDSPEPHHTAQLVSLPGLDSLKRAHEHLVQAESVLR